TESHRVSGIFLCAIFCSSAVQALPQLHLTVLFSVACSRSLTTQDAHDFKDAASKLCPKRRKNMRHQRRIAKFPGVALAALFALGFASLGYASDREGKLTEEFHHTYPLSVNGRIELDNINGAVHITAWDQASVKVDAVKYANTKERLDQASIEVE